MRLIGITQGVDIVLNRNERRDFLDQAWTSLLQKVDMLPVPLPNCPVNAEKYLKRLNLSGILLTGGNDLLLTKNARNTAQERDQFELQLLSLCSEKNIPVLGVCRGMQLMTTYFGGKIISVKNHVATQHTLSIHTNGVMPLIEGEVVNSFHNFGIAKEHLKDFWIIATSEDGYVEAIAHKEHKMWGIMWHPERFPFSKTNLDLLKYCFK